MIKLTRNTAPDKLTDEFVKEGTEKYKRNKEPIVLVEHNTSYGKEYIVGLNYIIQNGNLSWGQGYYYDDNKTKAVEDFNKVIAGGNLADTFKPKKQDRER